MTLSLMYNSWDVRRLGFFPYRLQLAFSWHASHASRPLDGIMTKRLFPLLNERLSAFHGLLFLSRCRNESVPTRKRARITRVSCPEHGCTFAGTATQNGTENISGVWYYARSAKRQDHQEEDTNRQTRRDHSRSFRRILSFGFRLTTRSTRSSNIRFLL